MQQQQQLLASSKQLMSFETAHVLASFHGNIESNFRNNVSSHHPHNDIDDSNSSSLSVDIFNHQDDDDGGGGGGGGSRLLDEEDIEEGDYVPMSTKHYQLESRTWLLCLITVMICIITLPFLIPRIRGGTLTLTRTLVPLDFYLDSFIVPKFTVTGDGLVAAWDVTFKVHNPNNSSVRIHDMRATLSYKDEAVISVSLPQRTSLRSNQTKTMMVKFETGSWYRTEESLFSFVAQPVVGDHVLGEIVEDVRHGDMSFVVKMEVTTGYVLPYLPSTADTVTHYQWTNLELHFTDLGNTKTSLPHFAI